MVGFTSSASGSYPLGGGSMTDPIAHVGHWYALAALYLAPVALSWSVVLWVRAEGRTSERTSATRAPAARDAEPKPALRGPAAAQASACRRRMSCARPSGGQLLHGEADALAAGRSTSST